MSETMTDITIETTSDTRSIYETRSAQTQTPVADFIRGRFSPRIFSARELTNEQLHTMFEAASWAASSSNLQPWTYVYGRRGTHSFDAILSCLNEANQSWARNAAALIVSLVHLRTPKGGMNRFAHHDVGMANATLLLQAQTMDVYGRMMGGYSADAVRSMLHVPEEHDISAIIAVGYLGEIDASDLSMIEREAKPRVRKSVEHIAFEQSPFRPATD